jgi:hypothetical protein
MRVGNLHESIDLRERFSKYEDFYYSDGSKDFEMKKYYFPMTQLYKLQLCVLPLIVPNHQFFQIVCIYLTVFIYTSTSLHLDPYSPIL